MKKFYDTQSEIVRSSKALVVAVYNLANSFTGKDETGIASHMTRTATSVPVIIAESAENQYRGETAEQHRARACAALNDLSEDLKIARALNYISEKVQKHMNGTIYSILDKLGASCTLPTVEFAV